MKIFELIKSGKFSEKELLNLRNNAIDKDNKEALEIIDKQIQIQFPKAAKKQYKVDALKLDNQLQSLVENLKKTYDLSQNKNGNHVKVGGEMIRGEYVFQKYLSYKQPTKGTRIVICVFQENYDSEIKIDVQKTRNKELISKNAYLLADFQKAADEYKNLLQELI